MAKLVDALDLGSSGVTHQSSNLCTRTNSLIKIGDTLDKNWRHAVEREHSAAVKLVDALDLGSSGVTHQSSNLCTPTKFHVCFSILGNSVGTMGLGVPNLILHHMRPLQIQKSIKIY